MGRRPKDAIPPPPTKTIAVGLRAMHAPLTETGQVGPGGLADTPASDASQALGRSVAGTLAGAKPGGRPTASESAVLSARADLLAMLWPLSELPFDVLQAVAARMLEQEFEIGESLIQQGRPSRHLLVLIDGTLKICVEDGAECREVARLNGEAVLGEMGLLTEEPCTATAIAVTPVRVLVLPAAEFRRLAVWYPVLSSALANLIATRLGRSEVDALVGKVLHGYRIHKCVGRGGMATVYQAETLASGKNVALKMMSHRFIQDLDAQNRFQREVQFCRSLRHANIARVLDCFTSFGTSFMVMEFCGGTTLDAVIRRDGPLPDDRVRRIAGQLARALDFAHRRGVCHRDVKPSNIMVGRRDRVRLLDFGLAKSTLCSDLTQQGCIMGTPRYMPPEQLSGQSVDYRADLFAFGCVVFEMIAGRPAFSATDVLAILRQQLAWSVPPPDAIRPGMNAALYQVLQESLRIEPAERVVDLRELGSRWK